LGKRRATIEDLISIIIRELIKTQIDQYAKWNTSRAFLLYALKLFGKLLRVHLTKLDRLIRSFQGI